MIVPPVWLVVSAGCSRRLAGLQVPRCVYPLSCEGAVFVLGGGPCAAMATNANAANIARRPSAPRTPLPPPPPLKNRGLARPSSPLGYFPYEIWKRILLRLSACELTRLAPCSKAMNRVVSQVWRFVCKRRSDITNITAVKVAMAIEKPFSCCWMPKSGRLAVITTSSELINLAVKGGVRIAFTTPEGKFDPSERVDISKEVAGSADVIVTDEGNFIVPDKENSCVVEFDPDGNELRRFGRDKMKWPRGVSLADAAGTRIIVADTYGNRVGIWSRADGSLLQPLGDGMGRTEGKFLFPWAAAVVPMSCRAVTPLLPLSSPASAPGAFLTAAPSSPRSASGPLLGSRPGNSNSLRHSGNSIPNAEPQRARSASTLDPPGGEILVADTNNHRIQVFSRAGTFLCMFSEGEGTTPRKMSFPSGVEVDGNDHVFVADSTARVQIWQLVRSSSGRVQSAQWLREFTIQGLSAEPKRLRMRDDGRVAIVDVSNIYFF